MTPALSRVKPGWLLLYVGLLISPLSGATMDDRKLEERLASADPRVALAAFEELQNMEPIPPAVVKVAADHFFGQKELEGGQDVEVLAFNVVKATKLQEILGKMAPRAAADILRPYLKKQKTVWAAIGMIDESQPLAVNLVPELKTSLKNPNGSVRYFAARSL